MFAGFCAGGLRKLLLAFAEGDGQEEVRHGREGKASYGDGGF